MDEGLGTVAATLDIACNRAEPLIHPARGGVDAGSRHGCRDTRHRLLPTPPRRTTTGRERGQCCATRREGWRSPSPEARGGDGVRTSLRNGEGSGRENSSPEWRGSWTPAPRYLGSP